MRKIAESVIIFLTLFLLQGGVYAQGNILIHEFSIPIGDDFIVYRIHNYVDTVAWNCFHQGIHCHFYVTFLTPGRNNIPVYGFSPNDSIQEIHITPNSTSCDDTIYTAFTSDSKNDSYCPLCAAPESKFAFRVNGYFDNNFKIFPVSNDYQFENYIYYSFKPYDTISFTFDTISKKYIQASLTRIPEMFNNGRVMIFNNKEDSIILLDWKISYDSSHSLSFIVKKDSLEVQSIEVSPLQHSNDLFLDFRSSLAPLSNARAFPGAIECHAHFAAKDSLCIIPLTFYFYDGPKSEVKESIPGNFIISTLVNHVIRISSNVSQTQSVSLQLFDALGRPQPLPISELQIPAGSNSQKIEVGNIPIGWYMLRMKTNDQVISKSFIMLR
jgi:hypothetical protein